MKIRKSLRRKAINKLTMKRYEEEFKNTIILDNMFLNIDVINNRDLLFKLVLGLEKMNYSYEGDYIVYPLINLKTCVLNVLFYYKFNKSLYKHECIKYKDKKYTDNINNYLFCK